MRRAVVRKGDTTTTGGRVLTGCETASDMYRQIARRGDQVFCPACKTTGFIYEGHPTWLIRNREVALHNHIVQCRCPLGANRLIASVGAACVDI